MYGSTHDTTQRASREKFLAMNGQPGSPTKSISVTVLSVAGLLLGLLLWLTLAGGSAFDSFPGRTIGISLLSDVDPHYRITVYLLSSALAILAVFTFFTLSEVRPGWSRSPRLEPTTVLLAACAAANLLAGFSHDDRSLFFSGAALCAMLLASWLWHLRTTPSGNSNSWALRLALAWQGTTLIMWLSGLPEKFEIFYALLVVIYLLSGRVAWYLIDGSGRCYRLAVAAAVWLTLAPVLLTASVELAYFAKGAAVSANDTLLVFAGLSLILSAIASVLQTRSYHLVSLSLLGVLLSTFIINQYENEILYRGYDLFHLAERMLPLHQWDAYNSIPFLDYHPGHGLFDLFPHGFYHLLNRGDPLEAALWGNGYFLGWAVQAVYIALFFACLSPVTGPVMAFLLLFLLPVFHILEPYNALLLLPVLRLLHLPGNSRPLWWWILQWLLVLVLLLWRPDFGLVVGVANLVIMAVLSWHRGDLRHLKAGAISLITVCFSIIALALLTSTGDKLLFVLGRWGDMLDIQLLAASYDTFYKQWDYLTVVQYFVMPLVGALAGGYSLARVYLRKDRSELAVHLIVIFVTAVGFALSIRLFQRHSILEGFTKTNFFYFAALFAFLSLRIPEAWRGAIAVALVTLAFIATPKTYEYSEKSRWSPRRSYPVTTHEFSFPDLAREGPRLVDRVTKYAAFEDFSAHFLKKGDAFYDFSNAPMLYMLAGVKLPVYVNETVWHTSEKIQDTTLAELHSLYTQQRLPFVVFRRNKPRWDALDGVDNALRSYKMAEYIYRHYTPCLRVSGLDIWTDKRIACRRSMEQRLPADLRVAKKLKYLKRGYLDQFIEYRHLPYIWANFDTHEDRVVRALTLVPQSGPGESILLSGIEKGVCRNTGCFLDLEIESASTQDVELHFKGRPQLSFTVRPGRHRYRIRLSALWRWHQNVSGDSVSLQFPIEASVLGAQLVELAGP